MGVAGGPDIERDGLVFGMDTGYGVADNSTATRFYPGEPTVNLHTSQTAFIHSSASGNAGTITDAPEKGPGWKKFTITARGTNFRTLQFTYFSHTADITYTHSVEIDWGNMRDKGYYMNHDGTGTGTRNMYKPGNYTTSQGSSFTIDSSISNGRVAGSIVHTASHTHAFFINNNTTSQTGLNDFFYFKDAQVEANTHSTPYSSGTRSSTQSLIDLTKTTDIDVSNVSFDSTGQPTFDGTDDYIDISNHGITSETSLTVLYWFKMNWISSWSPFITLLDSNGTQKFHTWFGSDRGIDFQTSINSVKPMFSANSSSYPNNEYINIVMTVDGTGSNNVKCYVNGVYKAQGSLTFNSHNITDLRIGRDPGNAYGGGDMPVVRIYNRALFAEEVQQNYNAYKNRFNL